jgi:hypothetical protein
VVAAVEPHPVVSIRILHGGCCDHVHNGTLTESQVRDALARAAEACGLTADDGTRAVHTTITSALRSGGRTR